MKFNWFRLPALALILLVITLILLTVTRKVPRIIATWENSANGGNFLFPRKTGGVVVAGFGSTLFWLDKYGKLIAKSNIAPDGFFFPLADGDKFYSGTRQGYVYAFDLETGALLWKAQPHSKTCSVTFDETGLIYSIGKRVNGKQQIAVLGSNGTLLRRYSLDGDMSGWPAPVVTETGTLVGGDTSRQAAGLRNADLGAYDANGKKLWHRRLTGFSVMHIFSGYRGDVICVAHQNRVFSVDIKTGKINWEFANPYPPHDGFYEIYRLLPDKVLVANSRHLFCLDASGKQLWQHGFPGAVGSCVVMSDGTTYLALYTTVVPSSLTKWWFSYQAGRGSPGKKFPLPTGNKEFLYSVSPAGKVHRLGRLDGGASLQCSGPEGEIYSAIGSVSRIDP